MCCILASFTSWMEEQCTLPEPMRNCFVWSPTENACAQRTMIDFHGQIREWVALWTMSRNLLLSTGIWGRVDEPVQTRLHRAYLAFKTWCATNQISCSQPAFQPKMDTWNAFVIFCGMGWSLTIFLWCFFAAFSIPLLNQVVSTKWRCHADLQSL